MNTTKVAIIGAGAVGTTIAYTLAQRNFPAEITLLDIDEKRCKGEILDLSDALVFCKTSTITAGTYQDAQKADIIIFAAGKRQEIDQKRTELLSSNKRIVHDVIKKIVPFKKDAILIMVTNPVDILTLQALSLSGLPKKQVFGSGTILDSMRLRELLAEHLKISARSIHAYILGEHGDSQFPAWSISSIGGTPLLEYPNLDEKLLAQFATQARERAYEIIKCKGATYYGVASCVAALCENILFDQKALVPLSCFNQELELCLSMPCILGKAGIEQQPAIKLNTHEIDQLKKSAAIIARDL